MSIIPKTINGRVNAFEPELDTKALFTLYDKMPVNVPSTFRDATKGEWCETNLSRAFFSRENVQILQNAIKAGVYKMSNKQYVIADQNVDTLHIIMRSVFMQNAINQEHNIKEQINQLNNIIVEYSVPRVYSSLVSHNKYIRDASTLPEPLAPPKLMRDSKQLPRLNYGFDKEN